MKNMTTSIVAGLSLLVAAAACADVRLPGFFNDHMVLQQGMRLPVWGWAAPGEQVTVAIAGQKASATADKDGKWRVTLEPLKADGKSLELTVTGKNTLVFKDVLAGEVWLCGGQSNMVLEVRACYNAQKELAAANLPQIRMYNATRPNATLPQDDHNGKWEVCTPQTVGWWSAVGFFFARDIHKNLGVPVGIINTSLGGRPIRTFMSIEANRTVSLDKDEFEPYQKALEDYLAHREQRDKAVTDLRQAEQKRLDWMIAQDKREADPTANAQPDADVSKWTKVELPLAKDKNIFPEPGIYWLRKQVEIPKEWLGRELGIGAVYVGDNDQPFLNGKPIEGGLWVDKFGSDGWRWYLMKPESFKDTKLTVAIRIISLTGKPFLTNPPFAIFPREMNKGEKQIPLAGTWLMTQSVKINAKEMPVVKEIELPPGNKPGDYAAEFNSSIHPLARYGIRGALWYQGEGEYFNTPRYHQALSALIKDWRTLWGQGDFPFCIVQLPNYMARQTQAIDHGWPELREVQMQVSREVKNAGIVVTVDIGDGADAHPRNKQDVGKRLALWALANVYDMKDLNWSSPTYKSMKVDGGKIRVTFDHTAGGLQATGGEPMGFAIAGKDKVFHLAHAKIDGDNVVVWSDKVKEPVAVRYAWANNPVCNLFNKIDLPAMPFRTDNWGVKEVQAAPDEKIPAAPEEKK